MKFGITGLLFGLLASTALNSPAYAQVADVPIPPTRQPVDGNGVNLVTGAKQVNDPAVSIEGSQGLQFQRVSVNPYGT